MTFHGDVIVISSVFYAGRFYFAALNTKTRICSRRQIAIMAVFSNVPIFIRLCFNKLYLLKAMLKTFRPGAQTRILRKRELSKCVPSSNFNIFNGFTVVSAQEYNKVVEHIRYLYQWHTRFLTILHDFDSYYTKARKSPFTNCPSLQFF